MQPTPLSPDDARLTAYALGELEGEDLAAVQAALRLNPALRTTVDEIREVAGQFEAALLAEAQTPLAAETEPELAAVIPINDASGQRGAIIPGGDPSVLDGGPRGLPKVVGIPRFYYVVGGLAAACFAIYAAFRPPAQPVPAAKSTIAVVNLPSPPPGNETKTTTIVFVPPAAPSSAAEPAVPTTPSGSDQIVINPAVAPVAPVPVLPPPEVIAGAPLAPIAPTPPETPPLTPAIVAGNNIPPVAPAIDLARVPDVEPAVVLVKAVVFGGDSPAVAPKRDLNSLARTALAEDANDPDALVPLLSLATPVAPGEPSGRTLLLTRPIPASESADVVLLDTVVVEGKRETYADGRVVRRSLRGRGVTDRDFLPHAPPGALFSRRPETYIYTPDNEFVLAKVSSLSSFSIESGTSSYGAVRRAVAQGRLPDRDAVRIEELLNYFPYAYAAPTGDAPFAAALEVSEAPWAPEHRLVRVALQGREIANAQRAALNLVFLIDVSASMNQPNRLPLVKESLRMLVGTLRPDDRVAIVTYGSSSGEALPSTPVSRATEIFATLDALATGGTTNAGLGIQRAYEIAQASATPGGINRIVLCTDGDFNVGTTDEESLVRLIEEKARAGVYFTAFGFGMGDEREVTLERLADKGHGLFGYIDTRREAEKLLVDRVNGSLVTIAKDVKVHVDFNPAKVSSYRLIGYENPLLRKEDFKADGPNAGEIGAGHAVTALYEVVPVGAEKSERDAGEDQFRYQHTAGVSARPPAVGRVEPFGNELVKVSVDYKRPNAMLSSTLTFPLTDAGLKFANATPDFKFAAAVAQYGMILRDSPHKGSGTLRDVLAWANPIGLQRASADPGGHRAEFLELVRKTQPILQ